MKTVSSLIFIIVLSILSINCFADDYEQRQQTQIMQQQLDIQRQEQLDRSNKQFSDTMGSISVAIREKREREKETNQKLFDEANTKLQAAYDSYEAEIENINDIRNRGGLEPIPSISFEAYKKPGQEVILTSKESASTYSELANKLIDYRLYKLSMLRKNTKRELNRKSKLEVLSYGNWSEQQYESGDD